MASKWPQRQNLTSEFKSMAKVTYYSMLILPVLAFLWPDFQLWRRRLRPPRRRKLQDVDLLPQVKMGSLFMSQEDRIKTKSEAKTEAKKKSIELPPCSRGSSRRRRRRVARCRGPGPCRSSSSCRCARKSGSPTHF